MDDKIFLEGIIRMYQSTAKIKETDEKLDGSYFSKSEILEIISVTKENYNHLLWFKLLYSFGMNLQELVNLKVKDVDFDNASLRIYSGKRSTPRNSDIPQSLILELRLQCNHKSPEAYVFHGRHGRLHTRTIQKALEKIEQRSNKQITIAKLRKSIAVHLCQSGWDYSEIGSFLGHVSYRATRNLLGQPRNHYRTTAQTIDDIFQ